MKHICLAALTCMMAAPVFAGPFEGLYQPAGMNWSCRVELIGADGGALAIRGDWLEGVESSCELTQPTPVRDMKAVLYDAVCSGEGMEYTARVMILSHDDGVYVIRRGYVSDWRFCH
ncbi:hypothetical protein C8J27_104251 [Rhodobacter aestuarii]|uniref:Uncharacterized protein n=1 Tax=Rhodobacter aestuarii TaxID=453582 RepID=A0A1N7KRI0_9RHOB|nr:hypothetical protein [Rhodobacter aestuarii]PTV95613.1 hypothetical protein C8J27_104251 [Rhodobacter aestuarii]SIS64106.1 hypothetical protein SAMN05421580_1033 [Rhodobacter aestuarii]